MRTIVDNLRAFQINHDLTSLELAGILAVDIDTLVSWFDGDNMPDSMQRYRILRLIDVYK